VTRCAVNIVTLAVETVVTGCTVNMVTVAVETVISDKMCS
jgi:hypothetical protein